MPKRIIEARYGSDYRVWVRFADGAEGNLDVAEVIQNNFSGVFEPLKDLGFFRQVFVDRGTICWPNGTDLDPDVLHSHLTGRPIEMPGWVTQPVI